MEGMRIIQHRDISHIESVVFDGDGQLLILPSFYWSKFDKSDVEYFLYKHGIYVLPTAELILWLRENIIGLTIEIGSGNGAIGRALCIPITDSKLQESAVVKEMYGLMQQPIIKYPKDIEKLEAIEAIYKYKPQTVIGAFITHKWVDKTIQGNYWGVKEEKILRLCKRYIMIGNSTTHRLKPILKMEHKEYHFPWLITRSSNQEENIIYVWDQA